jgi:hypothetical protein
MIRNISDSIHQKIQQIHQEKNTLQGRNKREAKVKEGVLQL